MTVPITQLQPNALPGRRYGSFRRPIFIPKLFRLVATRLATWTLVADRQVLFVLKADGAGTFRLEV